MSEVVVEVFYSETCPHCPPQKELAKKFESEDVKVRLTNTGQNSGRAKKHGVRTVPTTVVSGPGLEKKAGFKGVMPEDRLETAIEVARGEKNPGQLENPTLVEKLKNKFKTSSV